jgi:S-(hydroxymethyl)glutathione dehydrogenase/alcohol dehydrogenase
VTELALDGPLSGEVLVRMLASGICHSDHHFYSGFRRLRTPIVLGHEGIGVIEEIGPDVTQVKEGDTVVFSLLPSCRRCRPCRRGDRTLCVRGLLPSDGAQLDGNYRLRLDGRDVGQASRLGTFAERLVCPADSCIVVHAVPDPVLACVVGCSVITGVGSVLNAGGVQPGDAIAVIGTGGVGMNAVAAARIAGASVVVAVDRHARKLDIARSFGATHTVEAGQHVAKRIVEAAGGEGVDVAVVATGEVGTAHFLTAYDAVRPGGRLVLVGAPSADLVSLPVDGGRFLRDQKTIVSTIGGARDPEAEVRRCLRLWAAGQLDLSLLVGPRYALDGVEEGFAALEQGSDLRGVIVFGGSV